MPSWVGNEVWDLLDDAVTDSAREALLLDAAGRVIAASAALRQRQGIDGLDLKGWYKRSHGKNPDDPCR